MGEDPRRARALTCVAQGEVEGLTRLEDRLTVHVAGSPAAACFEKSESLFLHRKRHSGAQSSFLFSCPDLESACLPVSCGVICAVMSRQTSPPREMGVNPGPSQQRGGIWEMDRMKQARHGGAHAQ